MTDAAVRAQLRAFIVTDLIKDANYPLADDENLFASGMIDSFSLAEIGVFAEQQFNVYIPDPDLTVAKMNSLNLMVARILRDAK